MATPSFPAPPSYPPVFVSYPNGGALVYGTHVLQPTFTDSTAVITLPNGLTIQYYTYYPAAPPAHIQQMPASQSCGPSLPPGPAMTQTGYSNR